MTSSSARLIVTSCEAVCSRLHTVTLPMHSAALVWAVIIYLCACQVLPLVPLPGKPVLTFVGFPHNFIPHVSFLLLAQLDPTGPSSPGLDVACCDPL